MKRFAVILSYLTTFLLVGGINVQKIQAESNAWLSQIAGSYQSEIWSGGVFITGITEFIFTENSSLIGSYMMNEGDSVSLGTLSDCHRLQVRVIQCIWTDKYGSGNLEFSFFSDFSGFEGTWQLQGTTEKYPWQGQR